MDQSLRIRYDGLAHCCIMVCFALLPQWWLSCSTLVASELWHAEAFLIREAKTCSVVGIMQDALTAADQVMEALELAGHEEEAQQEAGYQPNVLLRGQEPGQYVLQVVRAVRSHDLEAALTVLSFPDALKLLNYVSRWLEDASAVRRQCSGTALIQKEPLPCPASAVAADHANVYLIS